PNSLLVILILLYHFFVLLLSSVSFSFFFPDPPNTDIYTLSHTTLFRSTQRFTPRQSWLRRGLACVLLLVTLTSLQARDYRSRTKDRKSTRLNSSHGSISYAVFCLKKKKNTSNEYTYRGYNR